MNELISKEEIEQEIKQYSNIANTVTGFLLITLFLGALSTDNPQATAYLLLPIALGAFFIMAHYYPPSLKILEKMIKDGSYKNDKKELKNLVDKLKKKEFGYMSVFSKNIIYLWGALLYFSLLIPNIGFSIKTGSWFHKLTQLLQGLF